MSSKDYKANDYRHNLEPAIISLIASFTTYKK
jgi:hypothetical protein